MRRKKLVVPASCSSLAAFAIDNSGRGFRARDFVRY
jgi:hypothetical protein